MPPRAGRNHSRVSSYVAWYNIVSAHGANNEVAVDRLAGLIRDVHQILATVEQVPVDPIKAEPAVAVKKSVFADHILCLDCGQSFKMLKRHISTDHQMTPDEYRAKWELPPTYPPPNMLRRDQSWLETTDSDKRPRFQPLRRKRSVGRRRAKLVVG
jgi:predicted transcriptional regulator